MADILDTSACLQVSLADAIGGAHAICRVLLAAAGPSVPNRPMLWPADITDVNALHDPAAPPAPSPPAYVHVLQDVKVGGYGSAVTKDGAYAYNESAYPFYAKYYIEHGNSEPFWTVPDLDAVHIAEPVHVITHFNPIYGHWLLEIMPKLFAIRVLQQHGLAAPILLPRHASALMRDTIALIVPGCRIIDYDHERETVRAAIVVLPPMLQHDYVFNPVLQAMLADFLVPCRTDPGPAAIFVSRSALHGKFRELSDPEAMDRAAERVGLAIIRPETLPWPEQLRLFASARLIVGEYGSGMHNTMVSPAGARTVCLNVMFNVQSRIANSCGHDIGYLLDPDGQPRRFEDGWTDTKTYRIDPDEFERRIVPLMP